MMSEPANARPEFRLTWLTDPSDPVTLNFSPNPEVHGTMGINNKGQVCYSYYDGDGYQAWVWMPEYDAQLDLGPGWFNIGAASETNAPSIARDINESGLVVGQSNGMMVGPSASTGKVAIWTLGSTITLDEFDLGEGIEEWSGAHAVNDATDPVVVGDVSIDKLCGCGTGNIDREAWRAFRIYLDGSPPTIGYLNPLSNDHRTCQAFDVGAGAEPLIVGLSNCWLPAFGLCSFSEGGFCFLDYFPAAWDGANADAMDRPDDERGSSARGVNENDEIVGWGMLDDDPDGCFQIATYFTSPTALVFELGSIMPSGYENDESQAEAINGNQLPWAVGRNVTQDWAVVWKRNGEEVDDWDAYHLNALIGCSGWTIRQGHDINDSNWIVGIATNSSNPGHLYAVLLTPLGSCTADVNRDGCVDVQDMLQVINQWGACPPGVICYTDTDGNCAVDTVDLLNVNNAWCADPCPGEVPECCVACEQCQESFMGGSGPSGPLTIAELIQFVAESDAPSETKAEIIQSLMQL